MSDFFAREGGRKKNKKVSRRSKKYFSKVQGFLSVHSFYKDLKQKILLYNVSLYKFDKKFNPKKKYRGRLEGGE